MTHATEGPGNRIFRRGPAARVLPWLATLMAASGCGGSAVNANSDPGASGSAGSSSDPPTAATFLGRIAKSFCDSLQPCCASAGLRFDDAACEVLLSHGFGFDPSQVGNGVAFDSGAGQRCIDDLLTETMGCTANLKYGLSDCDQLLVGTLPVGASCTDVKACAAPPGQTAACIFDATGVNGTCQLGMPQMTHGASGDACAATCIEGDGCDFANGNPTVNVACFDVDGLYCSDALSCAPLLAVGEPCRTTADCATGTYCAEDGSLPSAAGVIGACATLKENGTPCLIGTECLSHACDGTCFHPPLAQPNLCLGIPDPPHD